MVGTGGMDMHHLSKAAGEMQAPWIWTDAQKHAINESAEFLQTFAYSGGEVLLKLSAADKYAVFINGKFVDCGQYDDYSTYKIYDSISISQYCQPGKNQLVIQVYYHGTSSASCVKSEPKLWYVLAVDNKIYTSGSNTLGRKLSAYANGEVETISPQRSFTFYYDARKENAEPWSAAHCIDCDLIPIPRPVEKVNILPAADAKILNQGVFISDRSVKNKTAAQMVYTDLIAPRHGEDFISFTPREAEIKRYTAYPFTLPCDGYTFHAPENYDGVYVIIDLGSELSGFPYLALDAEEGTVFDIAYGEHLDDGRVRAYVGYRNFAFRYTATGGYQEFGYYFKRSTGRYLELHARTNKPFTLYHLSIMHTEYPLNLLPYPPMLTDSLARKIYDISVNTLKLCMHEHYEDCPLREQAMYAMDSRNQALAGYYAFGEYKFPYACWKLFEPSIRPDGMFPITVPSENPKTIPSFNLAWIIACEELVSYGGQQYNTFGSTMQKVLDAFASRAEWGILSSLTGTTYWNYFEWADGLAGNNNRSEAPQKSSALTLFFYAALRSYGRLFDDDRYTAVMKEIEAHFHNTFWSKEHEAYRTFAGADHFAELVQALALWCGLVPDSVANVLRKELANDENPWIKVTISHYIYKIDALMAEPETYYAQVNRYIMEIWGSMVYSGSTTFWETIDGGDAFDKAGSLCHGWSAIPIYFWHKYGKYAQ